MMDIALVNKLLRSDIQYFRGIAVTSVVFYHAFPSVFPNGYLGVDAFFVISGFVVTPLVNKIIDFIPQIGYRVNVNSLKSFLLRRFFRLAPALGSTLTFFSIPIFLLSVPDDSNKYAFQSLFTLMLAGNAGAYKLTGNYFHPNPNPLIHTWSLSVEEQIYIGFPIALMVCTLLIKNMDPRKYVIPIIGFVSFCLFFKIDLFNRIFQFNPSNQNDFIFYSPFTRAWEFVAGSFVFYIKNRQVHRYSHRIYRILLNFSLLLLLFSSMKIDQKFGSLLIVAVSMLLIDAKGLTFNNTHLWKILKWFGDRSYSIYLLHMPFLFMLIYYSRFTEISKFLQTILILLVVLMVYFFANLNYKLIEKRYRKTDSQDVYSQRFFVVLGFLLVSGFFSVAILAANNTRLLIDPLMPKQSEIFFPKFPKSCDFEVSRKDACGFIVAQAKGNILLIGDSHAGSITPVMTEIASIKQKNLFWFTSGGCPYFLENETISFSNFSINVKDECKLRNRKVLEFIDSTKIDTIIYYQRASVGYVTPNTFENRKRLNMAILKSIQFLSEKVKNVVVIGFTPELQFRLTPLEILLGRKNLFSTISYTDNSYWEKETVRLDLMFLDSYRLFCVSELHCLNKVNGAWLFRDSNHLTYLGSQKLKPGILELIN